MDEAELSLRLSLAGPKTGPTEPMPAKSDRIGASGVSVGHERPIRTGLEPARPLLSIGVFARRSRLSMKALRLYDRLGLLTPADVDPESGYRRYRESQLVTARLVAMLRRLDMPLTHVAEIVSAPGTLGVERLNSYWEAFERRVAGQWELVAHIRTKLSEGKRCSRPVRSGSEKCPNS